MISLDLAVNAIVAGLLLGGFYAAVTVGVTISFGMLDIVNIAHPAFIMLGSFIAYFVNQTFGIDYRSVDAGYIGASFNFGVVGLPMRLFVPFVVSMTMMVLLELFLGRTFFGRAIKAVSQDRQALQLMAANPAHIKELAFGLSIAT